MVCPNCSLAIGVHTHILLVLFFTRSCTFSPEFVQFEQEYVKGGCGGGVSKWQLYLPPSSTSVGWLGPKLGGPPCRNLVKRPNGLVFTQNLPSVLGLSCFFCCHIWDLFVSASSVVNNDHFDWVTVVNHMPKDHPYPSSSHL